MGRNKPEIEDVQEPFCGIWRKNMIALADYDPDLALEWCYRKNCGFRPEDFSHASHVRAWWTCPTCSRDYKAAIGNRVVNKSSCPYCANRLTYEENSLAGLYPDLAKEWHVKLNGKLRPGDVQAGSHKRVWWSCSENRDHVWFASLTDRTRKNAGCPACAGKQASVTNSLASLFPEIARQWHKRKNGKLRPFEVTSKSTKVVWWRCESGHSWQQRIATRTSRLTGCSRCRTEKNSLQRLYPEIARDWHKTKNGRLRPIDVTGGSNKKVWWQCRRAPDHQWQTTISNRTYRGTGCPKCWQATLNSGSIR